jgi:plastocyanin
MQNLSKVKGLDMNKNTVRSFSKSCSMFMATLCLAVQSLWATTHVVQFGGSVGFAYSPSSFSAKVGDTVKWEGAFSAHPLSSTSVPATAQTWSVSTGSSFVYVIKVAGTYNYQCDLHFAGGMIGSFTATGSAVRNNFLMPGANRMQELQLGVSDVSRMPVVTLTVLNARRVSIKIFDLSGREQATVLDRVVAPGSYSIPLGSLTRASRYYFVSLSSDGLERTASFVSAN